MKTTPYIPLLVLVLLLLLPLGASNFYLSFATDVLIYTLLALSLNLLVGYGGLVSFGHAAYFGVGAYTCGLLMKTLGWSFSISLLAAVLVSVLVALVAGFFCVRLTKVYFSMLTLAFSQIIWAVVFRWNDVTGGDQGVSGIPYPDFSWLKQIPALAERTDSQFFYYLVLLIVAFCTWLVYRLIHSGFGRCLIASRENPERCTFIGLNVRSIQLITFCIAAGLAGVAGSLFGIYNRGLFPDFLHYSKGAEILIMVLLGGSGYFWGAAVGAIAMLSLQDATASYSDYWGAILGVILATLTLLFPDGLTGIVVKIKQKLQALGRKT
jgi:branched-chain amino acid transport system permease protein